MKILKKLFKTPTIEEFEKLSNEEKKAALEEMEENSNFFWNINCALIFGVIALNVIQVIKAFQTNNMVDLFLSMLFIYLMSINFIVTKLLRDHRTKEGESYMHYMDYAINSHRYITTLEEKIFEYEEKLKDYENTGGSN